MSAMVETCVVCGERRDEVGACYCPDNQGANTDRIAELNAQAAAIIEKAAAALERVVEDWDCGHNESRLCDCQRDKEQWGYAADEIRALDAGHLRAALNTMLAKAEAKGRKEGMLEAAQVINTGGLYAIQSRVDAILAAAEKEAGRG